MIEKLNRVFEKLPPEHRDIMREAFTILIEEVINAVVKDNERIWQVIEKTWQTMKERFERQEKENERIWQTIERVWRAIEKLEKTMREGFERQEKENEKIWQAIKEGFERQAQENEKMWQAIKEGFERQEKENQRIWQSIEELRKDMKEGFERMNRKIDGLGARWGLMAEETFRAGIKTIIEDLGYAVENIVFFDDEGYVFLKPSRIEIDIIVKDGRKIAVEIKSSVSEGDVSAFERKVKLYEKKFNIKIDKKIILTPFANSKAIEIAKSLGIEIVEELRE
ncbi:MAG: DUF3782 domain-containing protein [Candidatus Hydrothermia bacterium]|jgi:hypothetical protein